MRIPFLSKLFGQEGSQPKPSAPRSVHHNPKDIAASLKKYAEANSLIEGEINPNGKNSIKFTTGIINIDTDNRTIIFDSLTPTDYNNQFAPGCLVRFTLCHLGIRTQFDAQYQDSIGFRRHEHLFNFPKGIEHIQLRDAFRIKISTINPARITLENEEKNAYSGYISDLSVTGARVRLPYLIQPQPHRGDMYDQCYITLSDGQRLISGAQLIHWQYNPKKETTDLGVKFLKMSPGTERKLNRFLTELQRKERIKK